jgi:hypothetical protein
MNQILKYLKLHEKFKKKNNYFKAMYKNKLNRFKYFNIVQRHY